MTLNTNYTYIFLAGVGLLAIGIVGKRAGWFKIISGTNALLKEQNSQLRSNEILLRDQLSTAKAQLKNANEQHDQDKANWAARHQESLTEIAKLQGRVETLTAMPLKAVNETLRKMVELTKQNADSNSAILRQLQVSAEIASKSANDGGLLVKTKPNTPVTVKVQGQ